MYTKHRLQPQGQLQIKMVRSHKPSLKSKSPMQGGSAYGQDIQVSSTQQICNPNSIGFDPKLFQQEYGFSGATNSQILPDIVFPTQQLSHSQQRVSNYIKSSQQNANSGSNFDLQLNRDLVSIIPPSVERKQQRANMAQMMEIPMDILNRCGLNSSSQNLSQLPQNETPIQSYRSIEQQQSTRVRKQIQLQDPAHQAILHHGNELTNQYHSQFVQQTMAQQQMAQLSTRNSQQQQQYRQLQQESINTMNQQANQRGESDDLERQLAFLSSNFNENLLQTKRGGHKRFNPL